MIKVIIKIAEPTDVSVSTDREVTIHVRKDQLKRVRASIDVQNITGVDVIKILGAALIQETIDHMINNADGNRSCKAATHDIEQGVLWAEKAVKEFNG